MATIFGDRRILFAAPHFLIEGGVHNVVGIRIKRFMVRALPDRRPGIMAGGTKIENGIY